MIDYEEEIDDYAKSLEDFIGSHELPEKWFKRPDHIAIKCADGLDYEYRLQELSPDSSQSSQIEMDGRRLATLHLITNQAVGNLGSVEWLEVMEPRPEKVGKGIVGLEHMEFYFPDFKEVTETLVDKNLEFELEENPGHRWVNIVINASGQELKLNDRLLADIVEEELENGISHLI